MLFDDDLKETERLLREAQRRVAELRQKILKKTNKTSTDNIVQSLDNLECILKDASERVRHTDPPSDSFYPEEGTVFIDTNAGEDARPLIVENKKISTLSHDSGGGCVVFYDREEGLGEYFDWSRDLANGRVRVIWSPKCGVVQDNDDYMTRCGLLGGPPTFDNSDV